MSRDGQGVLRTPVDETDHVLGPANAPVTLVEYGDFECPFCFRAHPVVTGLRMRLGDSLRFVFRNFPLTQIHRRALPAAIAAEAVAAHAGPQAYWRMHDAIYDHQQDSEEALDDEHLLRYAKDSGANPDDVARALAGSTFEDLVRTHFRGGVKSGVNGTPTFFINGVRFDGDWNERLGEALVAAGRPQTGGSS